MKIFYALFSVALLLLFACASAQVKTNFNSRVLLRENGLFKKAYKTQVDFEVQAIKIEDLLRAEQQRAATSDQSEPFKLAIPIPVDLNIAKRANWNIDSGFAYGKFTIKLNGALSSSINFDKFYLPTGAEMYIYNEKGNMITGPVTAQENNAKGKWGSWVYKDDLLTVEIKIPLAAKDQLILHANNIAYGYKSVYKVEVADFNASDGSCEINVICPLGSGWEAERNSVALVLNDDGSSWCSGPPS
jgi:lysyl endopeptidase